jgi:hypothetical protein
MIVYSTIPTKIDGGQQEAIVSDWDTQALLSTIVKELKKMNLHMSLVNDMNIENTEVEV